MSQKLLVISPEEFVALTNEKENKQTKVFCRNVSDSLVEANKEAKESFKNQYKNLDLDKEIDDWFGETPS